MVNDLVECAPRFILAPVDASRFVRCGTNCWPRLSVVFRDQQPARTAERTLATNILADYAADQPQVLADLLMDADEKQFAVIYPKFKEQASKACPC